MPSRDDSRRSRDVLRLARNRSNAGAKRGALGAGSFGAAGLIVMAGLVVLIAAAVAALTLVLAMWMSALVVGGALLVVAGVAARVVRRQLAEAAPTPLRTVDSIERHMPGGASRHDHA